jgi:hypothetical protein
LFLALAAMGQDSSQKPSPDETSGQQASSASAESSVTVPAGTRIPVALTYPMSSKTTQSGDDFHVQITAPVTVGNRVVIPVGTFIQGTVDKLSRRGDRGEVRLRGAQLIFPNGYIAAIAGTTKIIGSEGTAWLDPSGATKAGMILAPIAGAGIGTAIGASAHTTQSSTLGGQTITASSPRGIAIGSMAGLAAGAVVSLVLMRHSRGFYVQEGSPMEMTLPQPLLLSRDQVLDAEEEREANPVPLPTPRPAPSPVSPAPASHGMCRTPDIPGAPPTVIPGVPGPNGIPGPPTVIPGTAPTPGTPYPCP